MSPETFTISLYCTIITCCGFAWLYMLYYSTKPEHSKLTMSQVPYREWLETSIQDGSIFCCPESDIKLDDKPIAFGASGTVYKGTVSLSRFSNITKTIQGKRQKTLSSGMTVAVKALLPDNQYDCGEDLYQQYVKEVAY